MDCPKCGVHMQLGKASSERRLPHVFERTDSALVHDISFVAEGQEPVAPRLDGTAWMCRECDTLVLVGGW